MPASHGVASVEFSAQKYPAGHGVAALGELQKLPAGHDAGAAEPAMQRVPFEHGVGAAKPAAQEFPAGHTPHVALPVKVPPLHVRAPPVMVKPASHVCWQDVEGRTQGWTQTRGSTWVHLQVPFVPFVGAITLVLLHIPLRRHVLGGPSAAVSHSYAS